MKKKIKNLCSLLYQLKFLFSDRIRISNSCFIKTKIDISEFDAVSISNTYCEKNTISSVGRNNKIIIQGRIDNSELRVFGENNSISISSGCKLSKCTIVLRGVDCHICIGQGSTVGSMYMVCMGSDNSISIGQECMIADDVEIWATDSHGILDMEGNLLNPSKRIVIGNHVWIGKHSAIMKGVTIGDDSVIGMRSLVTKDVSPNTLNVGVPSKTIREEVKWDRSFITKYEIVK